MAARQTHDGRHRARHRAPAPARPQRGGLTIPGAAAAALTLTATGAAMAPGLDADAASADRPQPKPQAAGADATAHREVQDAKLDIAQDVAAERAAAAARAARSAERAQIAKQRREAAAKARQWLVPVQHYTYTSDFGLRWGKLHAGIDLAAPIGTRIGSLSAGTVVFAGQQSGYGNKVEVRHWDGTVSWYGHMSVISVHVGQKVGAGDKLGEVGNTGHSTGPHLHLEIHPDGGGPVDPIPWLLAHGIRII